MAKKIEKKRLKITPFRVSVVLNIVLGLIVVSVMGVALFAYHEYTNGSDRALRFALTHSSFDYYCNHASEKIDQWTEERKAAEGEEFSKEDAKKAKLLYESQCVTPEFEPYYTKAIKQFFKDQGSSYDQ
jgi:hypothetical protein